MYYSIFTANMIAFGMGPVCFLPQTPDSNYRALSLPGIVLATFGDTDYGDAGSHTAGRGEKASAVMLRLILNLLDVFRFPICLS